MPDPNVQNTNVREMKTPADLAKEMEQGMEMLADKVNKAKADAVGRDYQFNVNQVNARLGSLKDLLEGFKT